MNTGYNTDVRHGEVVFHVQTEDKGTSNPYIESLVYVGGQVLASKRASYAEMLADGKDEKDVVQLMDHQHRTMIAAIRHGKLDAKLAALSLGRQTGQHPTTAAVLAPAPSGSSQVLPPAPPAMQQVAPQQVPQQVPQTTAAALLDVGATLARPPVARPSPERTLDQVILEYLTSEADQEQLLLFLEEEQDLALGARALLTLRTSSSKSGDAVVGAQVSVRMISTAAEPRVLAGGRTDDRGVLVLSFDVPQLGRGTSALIISAVSAIGRAELKHLL
jgi:hypothetical protein